jgi:pentatricopeptide repeat protein
MTHLLDLRRPASALALAAALAFGAFLLIGSLRHSPAPGPTIVQTPVLRPGAPTPQRIAVLQAQVRAYPDKPDGYTELASAYLQRVRETGDAGFYTRAQASVNRALAIAPRDPGALTQRAVLELARHDFRAGLADAQRAHSVAPLVTLPYGPMVDGLVELGRYGEAHRVLQQMVDLKPDLGAYARVSYFRELHGNLAGALSAMQRAVSAGGEEPENVAYVQTLLGHLYLAENAVPAARHAYLEALNSLPGYPAALAGLARVDIARGHLAPAIRRLRGVVARLPLPEYVIALGETEQVAGRPAAARRDLALVGAEERLLAAAGVNTDTELAVFEADHGSPARAVALARRAWAAAPSVRSADALGWALRARGGSPRAALGWARRAVSLGTRDATFLAHAGLVAAAAGARADAHRWLSGALAHRAALSPLLERRAAEALR